jgi:amino acid adenylation domain-containing protein
LAAYLDQAGRATRLPPIAKQPAGAEGVLSFAQQRLWFLAHLEGQNAAYNMAFALKLHGQLEETALHQATTALIQRHECLRLCFPEVDGIGTVERIASYDPFKVIDLSALPDAARAHQVNDRLARHGKDAFDLTSGPLFNLHLLRLSEQEHVLLFNMHHIISDGWSMGVMVRDWSELYRAAAEQREPALPELSIQYTDYAAWQKDWLRGETLKAQLSYWHDKLANAPELLDLPTDFPRPAVKTYQGQHLQSSLPVGLVEDIKRVSREHGATVFMTLLSAFNVLLYRYSGQTDVLVGSPIANRTQRQTEDLIGFFVNTLVLRSQLDSTQTFVELLQQVRQTALAAYSHQDIPFEFLVEQLNPARSTSYSPLFQVMFILQNTPLEALEFGDAKVEILAPELTTAKFDLTLSMTEVGGGFICDWEYSTDLFEADSILRMAGHFETLLRELMRAPEQAVTAFSLLSPAEAEELQRWNATEFAYPRHQTLVDLFEAQAALHPGKIAVRSASAELSFAELNAQANQLAAHLCGIGVGADTLVGICVERSLAMLVGLLGILKAGGAYVPMDPDYPRERLHVMLTDSAIQVLLTQQHLINHLPESGVTLVCLDRDWPVIAAHSTANPDRSSGPDHLAYVIFTSGSTGRPKGVMIEHAALLNFLIYMQQRIGLRESDRFLALTTLSFDIAALELYLPLMSGSQVVIIPRETAMDGERLMQVMDEQRISIMQATPATWKLLLQSGWQQRTPLTILCGGEAMPGELGKKLLENSQQLWNVYGPTETTIWSAMQDCTRHPERPELIGRPIGNTQIYILDEHGCVVPPGMSGELCIAGHGLGRGYLNRPDLTAEKFIEMDVFGQRQTLYKTGDLARLLRNGYLECLGRIDHQVKLRGFRIELGEIEESLNRHPQVQEAAVISNQAKDSLLAYVVPRSGADADSQNQDSQIEQIKRWEQVWSDTYSQSSSDIEDTQRNTIGWNSSYTLEPIPQAEMQEWLDCTIEQVQALAPTRILEIGCGTGMLLFRLAPHCAHYTGVDISPAALRWIEQQTQGWAFADRVTLRQAAADQISGIEPGSVDLVIINSVIQYFPSVDYLIRVLRQAVELVAPGGQIFVGDVRNFQLLEAFHASIQCFQAEAELTTTQLRQRIGTGLSRERELLIDPDFFSALQQELPAIRQVRILLKNGGFDNEMTRFRYDAVLSIGAAAQAPDQAVRKLDWSQDALTLDKLSQMLADHCADILEIRAIPNARLATEQRLLAQLAHFEGTVADLKEDIADSNAGEWLAPARLYALTQDRSYVCTLYYGDRFHYTAVLQRVTPEVRPYFVTGKPVSTPRPWRSYANEPAVDILDKSAFVTELREYLQQQLPAYMVPGSFTVLDKLPLTPNGKINRKALPEPDGQRRGNAYHPPRDTVELQLAQIWEELLKTHPVGIRDNFFDLGGHSLLAVRLVAQIEQKFNQAISLSTLFHHGTIADIAKILRQQSEHRPWSCVVPIQPAGKNTPLFCVHPAGGNVLCYLELAQQLGANQPLYAFQAYGLEAEQTPYSEVTEMAQTYITAMKTVQPHGPYQIVGWSFGGPVAMEMATQLQARNESVTFLGLFDAIAPHIVRDILQEPEDDAQFFADYFAEADAELSLDYLRQLRPQDQIAYVVAQGRQAGIFPADVDVMQTRRLVNVYRTNMSALLRYHAPRYHGRITLFQVGERRPQDPTLPAEHGWQAYTLQPVEVIQVPGKHHTMMNLPHVQVLAQRLKSCLAVMPTEAVVDMGIE